ncbi:MAG: hypothetical protein KGZ52_02645 [Xanthomonadaceae bacterium]|nr:hypothetical protein [Xanthomonadaceae bacterium]
MIELRPALVGLDRIAGQLDVTPMQVDRALRITVNRMAAWVRRKSARALSSELKVALDVLRYRMRTLRGGGAGSRKSTLWFGLNPLALKYLDPRAVGRGVKAGPLYVKGAFLAKGQVFKRRGAARLPIDQVVYPIQQKADRALEGVIDSGEFERRFLDTFERELYRIWNRAST